MTDLAAPMTDFAAAVPAARLAISRAGFDRLALAALAILSAGLYLINLTVSGYANTYYAMAAQAASQSWSAMFFGALDSQGFITLDKPPLATALMGLSVKLFGLSSWSILLPQALLGVATVLVLYLAVRRSFGSRAALLAGGIMALTPAAVLIFRYDNPDALLTFVLVAAAWALGRGLEHGRIRWAILAAVLVGLGFLTKYLQAYMVLPAFALVWLVCAPGSVRRRLGGLLASGLVVAASSLWWVAIVELIPTGSRPYIGGSVTNSAVELLLGYDGIGRIFGNRPTGSGLGSGLDGLALGSAGPGGPTFGGFPGVLRLLNDQFGGQIGWLLPVAMLSIGVALFIHRRAARTDRRVAGYLLWGGWLVTHVLVFSFMSGIIHPYYTIILAPAIAALVGGVAVELWDRRATSRLAGPGLAAGLILAGLTAWALLGQTSAFLPGLGIAILALATAAAVVIALPIAAVRPGLSRVALGLAVVAILAAPLAYAIGTTQTAYAGGDPQAGPVATRGLGGGPGIGDASATADDALVAYLLENQGDARWIVAADGSQTAAPIQLAAGAPVMTLGGFTGRDPTPTVDELRAMIASGELRFVLVGTGRPDAGNPPDGGFDGDGGFGGDGGAFGPGGGPLDPNAIASPWRAWVTSSCTPVSVGGVASGLYDCAGVA
jgi:4-amino-4-deoxy-L-arabinose transferase-like glycosyltransferase